MTFKYGDIVILATPYFGHTLMMVVNPPIKCAQCGEPIIGWDYEDDGTVVCTHCQSHNMPPFEEVVGRFGEELISLAVASTCDDGTESPHQTPRYNWNVNKVYTVPKSSLESDINKGLVRLCGDEEAFNRKCMIVWTNTEGYVPGAPVPQEIKDMIAGN